MMDLPVATASHYECQVPRNYKAEKVLKEKIYVKMKRLDGWCPETKASFLMDLIFNHRPEIVVEVGVWGGKSLVPMAEAIKYNHRGIVYGIDPWKSEASVAGFNDENTKWWGRVDHESVMKSFLSSLKEYRLNEFVNVIRATSVDCQSIENIGLLHIDGNHSEDSALFDVKKWVPLVKQGGFVIFDDLDWPQTEKAVEWLDDHCQRITTFFETNAWGIWIKL